MKTIAIKDKHLKLDQTKIKKAQEILKAKTETEAVDKALELVIAGETTTVKKREVMKSLLTRRERFAPVKGDVADWVREGREEREKAYGG